MLPTHIIHWHRTDLRIHDSPSLQRALSLAKSSASPTYTALFTFDPHYVSLYAPGTTTTTTTDKDTRPHLRVGPNRWAFLLDCLQGLDQSYRERTSQNQKSINHDADTQPQQRLWVCRGNPADILTALCKRLTKPDTGTNTPTAKVIIVYETDPDPYATQRDAEVQAAIDALDLHDAVVVEPVTEGRTLWPSEKLVAANGGKPTMTFNQVVKAAEKLEGGGEVAKAAATPGAEDFPPSLDVLSLYADGRFKVDSSFYIKGEEYIKKNGGKWIGEDGSFKTYAYGVAGPVGGFTVPTMDELGFGKNPARTPIRGGEKAALAQLDKVIAEANGEFVATFEKPATAPTAFDPRATTVLSPHLHFGSLGVRHFYWRVREVIDRFKKEKKATSDVPVNLPGQLIFRDMYFAAQQALGGDFNKIEGNSVCRFIPWHLQKPEDVENPPPGDEQAAEWFKRWRGGMTGFPWIDALMRQLEREGWIHHLGRHAVACFLTRGGCYVSWERGAEVFEEWLLDHEPACNAGNWMWLSCSAFFAQFYRCYSPIKFPQKWDPNGDFVRRYVPELKDFDKKYIYEPWKAPIADQKKWGCRVVKLGEEGGEKDGKIQTYPKPMFDFDERRQICIDGVKDAYDKGLYGNDPKVRDGSWRKVFGVEKPKKKGHEDKASGQKGKKDKPKTKNEDETAVKEQAGKKAKNPEEGEKGKKRAKATDVDSSNNKKKKTK